MWAHIQTCDASTCALLLVTLSIHMPQTHLLSKLPIPDSQVITINPQLPVEEAAEDYAKKLRQVSPSEQPQGDLFHTMATPRAREQFCRQHCVIVIGRNSPGISRQTLSCPGQNPLRIIPLRDHSPAWVPKGALTPDTLVAGLGSHILETAVSPDSWPVGQVKCRTS